MNFFEELGEGLQKAIDVTKPISTLYNQLTWQVEPRNIVAGTPQAGYPEGRDEVYTNNTVDRAADVLKSGLGFFEQVKGLFGLGYPANDAQPVSPLTTEQNTTQRTPESGEIAAGIKPDIMILAGIGILLFLMLK